MPVTPEARPGLNANSYISLPDLATNMAWTIRRATKELRNYERDLDWKCPHLDIQTVELCRQIAVHLSVMRGCNDEMLLALYGSLSCERLLVSLDEVHDFSTTMQEDYVTFMASVAPYASPALQLASRLSSSFALYEKTRLICVNLSTIVDLLDLAHNVEDAEQPLFCRNNRRDTTMKEVYDACVDNAEFILLPIADRNEDEKIVRKNLNILLRWGAQNLEDRPSHNTKGHEVSLRKLLCVQERELVLGRVSLSR